MSNIKRMNLSLHIKTQKFISRMCTKHSKDASYAEEMTVLMDRCKVLLNKDLVVCTCVCVCEHMRISVCMQTCMQVTVQDDGSLQDENNRQW